MFGSILALAALLIVWLNRNLSSGFKERLDRVERAVDDVTSELRRLRAERGNDPGTERPTAVAPTRQPIEIIKSEAPAPVPTPALAKPPGSVPAIEPPRRSADLAPPEIQPPRHDSFEETLGTHWAVWAGGAALALGGLFLVRYSIEAGLLGPGVRVSMGALLAAALVAAGEWMRRGEFKIPVQAIPEAHIPSILTAAGTIVAFGTIYAAHALYGFIGPAAAFILLGATGILTMLGAALHGPWLAGLGLAGSFLAPMLVESNAPNPWPVVLYLGVVAASAYLLARTRAWLWLAWATVAGAVAWGPLILSTRFAGSAPEAHALIQLGLGAFFLDLEPFSATPDRGAKPDRVASLALAALGCLPLMAIAFTDTTITETTMFAGVAMAILLATAWRAAPAVVAASIAGILALAVLLVWPGLRQPADATLTAPYALQLLRLPENVSSFLSFAALATLIPAAVMVLRIWRGSLMPQSTAALYALAATVPPLLALIVTYLRVTQFDVSIPFALAGAVLTVIFAYAAEHFHKADEAYSVPAYNIAAGAFAAAAIAAFAFALVVSLERGYLTVALALTALGTSYVATQREIPLLRYAVAAIGFIVLGRLAWNPRIMGDGVGRTPVFNWLLIGYGVPAACFAYAARLLEPKGTDLALRLCQSLTVVFAGLLGFFEIRHLCNNGNVLHAGANHVESGLLTFMSLAFSFVLAKLHLGKANPVFDRAAFLFGAGALAIAILGLMLGANPLLTGEAVTGGAILNSLIPAYLLPGLAALYVAKHARGARPEWYLRAVGILAVVLIFLYVTMLVRYAFHGADISFYRETTAPEQWAYSVAWLALGIMFLAYGLVRGSLEARIASAALIVLTAIKVTVFDLAGIDGLWRALSFLCLGAVLIGIGLVYQKLVFARPVAPSPPGERAG